MSYTYTTLKQAIIDYTENNETTFVSNLPVFIKNTEDVITLEKNATLVPTPGQTEQEYLAGFLSKKRRFKFQKQDEINLDLISSNIKDQCSKAFRKKNEWTKLFEIFNN